MSLDAIPVTVHCDIRLEGGEEKVVKIVFRSVNPAANSEVAEAELAGLMGYFEDIGFTCEIERDRRKGRLTFSVKQSLALDTQFPFQMRIFVLPEMARLCGLRIDGDIFFEPVSD